MQSIRIPTDNNIQQYPHVFLTSPDTCDASVLDHGITASLLQQINKNSDDSLLQGSSFDEFRELHPWVIQQLHIFWDATYTASGEHTISTSLHESHTAEPDQKSLRHYFGWQSEQVIQNTYKATFRFGGTIPHHDYMKKRLKSRHPVFQYPQKK